MDAVGGPFEVHWENVTDSPGWLDMFVGSTAHLMAGDPDPYPELLAWVERCCVDQETGSYHWDSDGFRFLFTYMCFHDWLRIEDLTGDGSSIAWAGSVSPLELCGAFYRGFLKFGESPVFDAARWCRISVREWVEWLAQGPIDDLAAAWMKCSSGQIWEYFEDLFEYADGRNQGQDMTFPRIRPPNAYLCRVQTREMVLAPCWDEALQEARQELLKAFLEQETGLDYGCHPRELRSPQLDAWWEHQCSETEN